MTRTQVLVLGDVNPDLVLRGDVVPRFGQEEQLLSSADLVLGGSGGIMAHALARLGVTTSLLAAVGDDLYGEFVCRTMEAAGVDLTLLMTSPEPTGLTVVLSAQDDRTMLTLIGAIDAPPPQWLTPDDVPAADHLHISSFYLQPRRAAALPRLLPLVRAAGMTISLDTNLDPTRRFDGLAEVLPHVDYLLPNAQEALGMAVALGARADGPALDIEAAVRILAAYGPCVVVKDGSRGALCAVPDGAILRAGVEPMEPVDTTGAGDTFDAGFLAARLAGADLAEALRWGCAAGAAATQASGGTGGQPTRDELLAAVGRAG